MDRTYVLTVRDVPKSVNAGGGGSRSNHYAAAREKKKWQGVFAVEMMAAHVARGAEFAVVEIVVRWKRPNHRDVENWRHPIVKPLADAMQAYGLIPDDTEGEFEVRDLRFEYPETWPFADPRIKGVMDIKIEARYP